MRFLFRRPNAVWYIGRVLAFSHSSYICYYYFEHFHYTDVIMTEWCLRTPASLLFTKPFIQAEIKENIKAPRHWPLCGEFTGGRWIPAQRASNAENVSIWWRHHVAIMALVSYSWLYQTSYNMIIFYLHLPYFHVSNSALILQSTLVFSFYIDVVLTASI